MQRKLSLLLAAVLSIIVGSSIAVALSSYTSSIITTNNRVYHSGGQMIGSWAPHLRGIMRNFNHDLFFVSDRGPSVWSNTAIDYYKKTSSGSWSLIGSQAHLPGIQQNTASLMIGNRFIFSYGIDTSPTRYIEECYFDTVNPAYKTCNVIYISGAPFSAAPNSNYIGAAVDTDGVTRIVWWTTVGANGGGGQWHYIYNFGGGWNGPVTSNLSGYNDFAYVYGTLKNSRFIGVGQLFLGTYPTGTYQASMANFRLGEPLGLHLLFPKTSLEYAQGKRVWTGSDVLIEPSGAVHVMAATGNSTSLDNNIAYYYLPHSNLPPSLTATGYIQDAAKPRFTFNRDYFSIVVPKTTYGGTMIDVYQKAIYTAWGMPFDISSESKRALGISHDPNFGRTDAVFVESPQYQTLVPTGLQIGVMGDWYRNTDHIIWNFSLF
jgi:hypothetical protein